MMTVCLVVFLLLVCWCKTLESTPAVGVVGDKVNMNMTISDTTINANRYMRDPNDVILLIFTPGKTSPTYTDPNVTYTGNISTGFLTFILANLSNQSAGIYQYYRTNGSVIEVVVGEQYLVIAESPSTPVITGLTQQAVAGREYKLNCSAVSRSQRPGHNLTMFSEWKRDGIHIMSDDSKYGVNGTILTFRNLTKTDNNASLRCIAFEDQRVKSPESYTFPMIVYYGPDNITLSPSQMSYDLVENSSLNVNCSADCVPGCQYRWTGSGVNYPDKTGILSISKISRSQAGVFTCTASNPNITSNTATVTVSVTVQYPPVVNISSQNGTYTDTDIALTCSAHGVPEQYVFTLTHSSLFTGIMIRHPSFDNVSRGVIRYRFSNFMDTGIYMCTVNNGIADYRGGSVNKSVSETVWIKGPPIVTSSATSFHAEKGQSGRLAVEFYSSLLDPTITWYRDRNQSLEKLDSSDKYNILISNTNVTMNFYSVSIQQPGFSAALEIRNVSPGDFGSYQANVQNMVGGMLSRVLVLRPRGPPDVPHDFRIILSSMTTSSMGVEWLSGFHGGFNQTFAIEYREYTDTSWTKSTEEIFGGMTQDEYFNITVGGLHQATMYWFRMYAWNSYNRSEYSVVINATTFADVKGIEITNGYDEVIIGSAVGAVVLVAVAVVVSVVIFMRQRRAKLNGEGLIDNALYDSKGPTPGNTKNSSATGVEYDAVVKPKRKEKINKEDVLSSIYAQVGKTNKMGKKGEIYENLELASKSRNPEKMYENSINEKAKANVDNIYENPANNDPLVKRDGLLYADLVLNSTTTRNGPPVIIGKESITEYADIAYGKRGEPLHNGDDA